MTDRAAGKIVLIVGTSCAGKSTLARAVQDQAKDHFLRVSLDDVFSMVSERWGGGYAGPLSAEGFSYRASGDSETIVYGPIGRQVLEGMRRAVAAFARSGVNAIVDDMLLDREGLIDWAEALAGCDVLVVRVTAPPSVLGAREKARAKRQGLAVGHLNANQGFAADIEIDTSRTSVDASARQILAALSGNAVGTALWQASK